jgi:hypothetical protein
MQSGAGVEHLAARLPVRFKVRGNQRNPSRRHHLLRHEPGRLLAASVGCAVPTDKAAYGYISEYHAFGQCEKQWIHNGSINFFCLKAGRGKDLKRLSHGLRA